MASSSFQDMIITNPDNVNDNHNDNDSDCDNSTSTKRRKIDHESSQPEDSLQNVDLSQSTDGSRYKFKNTASLKMTLSPSNIGNDKTDMMCKKLTRPFFDVPCAELAKKLLGQRIIRLKNSQRICGRIVETEAYLGSEDKAAHSYKGKRTARNEAMFMDPGTSYVYNIYGMNCCLNISSQGEGAAVLIRALEVCEGEEIMSKARGKKQAKKVMKKTELANGPSKLCQALDISKNEFNQIDLTTSDTLFLEEDESVNASEIVSCARINIGYADDWKDKPLRFYVLGNKSVSKRDRQAEQEID